MEMPALAVHEFSRTMIDEALRANDLSFTEDGEFFKVILPLEAASLELTGLFSGHEPADKVYVAQFSTGIEFVRDDWGEGLHLCHEWNYQPHLLTASFHMEIPNSQEGEVGIIVLRAAINFSSGIHQEFVNQFTIQAGAEALSFWENAVTKQRSVPGD